MTANVHLSDYQSRRRRGKLTNLFEFLIVINFFRPYADSDHDPTVYLKRFVSVRESCWSPRLRRLYRRVVRVLTYYFLLKSLIATWTTSNLYHYRNARLNNKDVVDKTLFSLIDMTNLEYFSQHFLGKLFVENPDVSLLIYTGTVNFIYLYWILVPNYICNNAACYLFLRILLEPESETRRLDRVIGEQVAMMRRSVRCYHATSVAKRAREENFFGKYSLVEPLRRYLNQLIGYRKRTEVLRPKSYAKYTSEKFLGLILLLVVGCFCNSFIIGLGSICALVKTCYLDHIREYDSIMLVHGKTQPILNNADIWILGELVLLTLTSVQIGAFQLINFLSGIALQIGLINDMRDEQLALLHELREINFKLEGSGKLMSRSTRERSLRPVELRSNEIFVKLLVIRSELMTLGAGLGDIMLPFIYCIISTLVAYLLTVIIDIRISSPLVYLAMVLIWTTINVGFLAEAHVSARIGRLQANYWSIAAENFVRMEHKQVKNDLLTEQWFRLTKDLCEHSSKYSVNILNTSLKYRTVIEINFLAVSFLSIRRSVR